jgi:N-acetylglucosaminyldiphosphoundecaprenol N-acetyl-beta-D-mannosaminyltransferase
MPDDKQKSNLFKAHQNVRRHGSTVLLDDCSVRNNILPSRLMGIRIVSFTFQQILEKLIDALAGTSQNSPYKVAFLNAHNTNVAMSDSDYRHGLSKFDFVFPDGVGLRIAGFWLNLNLLSNAPGTDLIPALLRHNKCHGIQVFLLGHKPEAEERVIRCFTHEFSNVVLAGYHHGFFNPEEDNIVIDQINSSGADLLLIGMGTPKQEKWLISHYEKLRPRLQITVGGLFQYWDGSLVRAPKIARRLGLEWFCILCQQPHKWKRYILGNPLFILRIIKERHALKRQQ